MADQTALLNGLREYHSTLSKHIGQLREEYETVSREWQSLEVVYHGDAAHEFKDLWVRTGDNFQEYLDRAQRILQFLDERIAYLLAANMGDMSS